MYRSFPQETSNVEVMKCYLAEITIYETVYLNERIL